MDALMEGPLSKWTNVMKGWQYRWFVLDDNSGILSYYTSRDKMIRGSRRGCVRLRGAIIGIDDDDDSTFTITCDQKIFHFQARDCDERSKWVGALEDTIMRHTRIRSNTQEKVTIDDFNNKLSEADAYLALLIEQVRAIELKINNIEEPEEHHKYEDILMISKESIEAVKQSIVLLQMSKNSLLAASQIPHQDNAPRNAGHQNLPDNETKNVMSHEINLPPQQKELNPPTQQLVENQNVAMIQQNFPTTEDSTKLKSQNSEIDLENASFKSLDSLEDNKQLLNSVSKQQNIAIPMENGDSPDDVINHDNVEISVNTNNTTSSTIHSVTQTHSAIYTPHSSTIAQSDSPIAQSLNTAVPLTSYSSSEDENDEFFDADEEQILTPRSGQLMVTSKSEGTLLSPTELPLDEITTPEPEQVTHDDLYMNEDDHSSDMKEGESIEEHKSVIMHLLSQVKLGMDLTKVVLPTFILERRSLLEMYADFFAHPDMFINIADQPDPESRMIECLRWYLSAFHAGRKGSVAKKPYNPILGEKFQCFWNIPNMGPDEYKVSDGPVPWAHRNNVTFLAEQVSHHPPVSAFYSEHHNKRIQFNGHIWTKSKFLGLSIGVHNIGQGCVRLLDLEEEYIMMFPNGYGRSILTVPWVELGGACPITCEKTGYSANITFHTKPFYGGKVHRVTAEVLAPGAKKPLLTVDGEWNGIMTAKWTKTGKTECFIDTKRIKIIQKCVRKLEHQERKESRKLWKDVTHNLKINNIDKATEHKRALEEEQRGDARTRAEQGIVYKTNDFHEDSNGNWVFKNPLINRT